MFHLTERQWKKPTKWQMPFKLQKLVEHQLARMWHQLSDIGSLLHFLHIVFLSVLYLHLYSWHRLVVYLLFFITRQPTHLCLCLCSTYPRTSMFSASKHHPMTVSFFSPLLSHSPQNHIFFSPFTLSLQWSQLDLQSKMLLNSKPPSRCQEGHRGNRKCPWVRYWNSLWSKRISSHGVSWFMLSVLKFPVGYWLSK